MEIVSKIALITINETLVIQLVSFLIFLFVINRMMFRPVSRYQYVLEHDLASLVIMARLSQSILQD